MLDTLDLILLRTFELPMFFIYIYISRLSKRCNYYVYIYIHNMYTLVTVVEVGFPVKLCAVFKSTVNRFSLSADLSTKNPLFITFDLHTCTFLEEIEGYQN